MWDFIDKAYYINLLNRPQRRQHIESQIAKVGLTAERFPAVIPTEKDGFGSLGERGCYDSHLAVLGRALAEKRRNVLIFEDDATFTDDVKNFPGICDFLSKTEWDLFYFEVGRRSRQCMQEQCGSLPLWRMQGVLATHAYMVNGSSLANLIEKMRHFRVQGKSIDVGLAKVIGPTLRVFGAIPSLAFQRGFKSDLR